MVVTAPFQFARIPRAVWFPEWGPLVSHDVPFADGYSGTIEIEIEAMTPLLIGGERRGATATKEGEVWPVQLPDGTYAIPGSSLQGMIRNILEIACFGKLGPWVEKRRFGIRDISGSATGTAAYGSRMTELVGNVIHNKVQAGWLVRASTGQEIIPCEHARIHIDDIVALSGTAAPAADILRNCLRSRNDAKKRYQAYFSCGTNPSLDVFVAVDPVADHAQSDGHQNRHARCSSGGVTPGTLVITGKPQTGVSDGQKKRDFIFHNPDRLSAQASGPASTLPISSDVWRDFESIHEAQPGRKINPNWECWKSDFESNLAVPVFYLVDPDDTQKVTTFGTAFMFKVAHENDTHDMLKNSSEDHFSEYNSDIEGSGRFDLSSLIFGAIEGQKKRWFKNSLKRRASFETAVAIRPENPIATREGPTVLLGPKPSYFPIYVRQPFSGDKLPATPADHRGKATTPYAVYHGSQELAGTKIWPVHGAVQIPAPTDPNKAVQGHLNALNAGTVFKSKLHVHNLRKAEVGALIWALTFGEQNSGNDNFWHRIGIGKPFQWGAIKIRVGGVDNLISNAPSIDDDFLAAFKHQIQGFCKEKLKTDWDKTPQYAALKKASQKSLNSSADFKQMCLDEFAANKNANVPNFLRGYVDVVEAVATYPNGFPFVEDAPIRRKRDGLEGFLREKAHGNTWYASFNGAPRELIHPGDVDVTGPPDE
jgi:CRISPR-associated protein (TIGR03986 family)